MQSRIFMRFCIALASCAGVGEDRDDMGCCLGALDTDTSYPQTPPRSPGTALPGTSRTVPQRLELGAGTQADRV